MRRNHRVGAILTILPTVGAIAIFGVGILLTALVISPAPRVEVRYGFLAPSLLLGLYLGDLSEWL
jgi:hypothetical protein